MSSQYGSEVIKISSCVVHLPAHAKWCHGTNVEKYQSTREAYSGNMIKLSNVAYPQAIKYFNKIQSENVLN